MKFKLKQAPITGKFVHPIGTLTASLSKFDWDKSNLTILVWCYLCLSLINLVSVCMPNNLGYQQYWMKVGMSIKAAGDWVIRAEMKMACQE